MRPGQDLQAEGDGMNDWRDDGQAAHEADKLLQQREEEEALKRVIQGKATVRDAETLACATGHDFQLLTKETA